LTGSIVGLGVGIGLVKVLHGWPMLAARHNRPFPALNQMLRLVSLFVQVEGIVVDQAAHIEESKQLLKLQDYHIRQKRYRCDSCPGEKVQKCCAYAVKQKLLSIGYLQGGDVQKEARQRLAKTKDYIERLQHMIIEKKVGQSRLWRRMPTNINVANNQTVTFSAMFGFLGA
jgi:hypothetical protein